LIAEIRRLGLEAEILARGAYVDGSLRPHQSGANGISIDSAAFAGLTGVHHRCKNVFTFFYFGHVFYVFKRFFIFQTFFYLKKRWQSSEPQAD